MSENPQYEERRKRLAQRIDQEGLNALWITNLVNIRYLTGFTGSYAQILLTPGAAYFFTDGRYREQVDCEISGCSVRIFVGTTWLEVFAEEVVDHSWNRIGIEAAHLNVSLNEEVQKLRTKTGPVEWVSTVGWVEDHRVVKDEIEQEAIRSSSRVVDQVFEAILGELHTGVTEREILRKMQNLFCEMGATGPSFDPIVLFGARSSLPHGKPGTQTLKEGDWVLLDFGVVVEGYCSDCTRTFVFGEPDSLQKERHALVSEAYRVGISAARAGIAGKDTDAAARRVIEEAGLGEAFMHGLGHGVGLEIHETPRLAPSSKDILRKGSVVTIEPGIYIAGWGGIRIEDAVIVGEDSSEPVTFSDHSISPF
jgi:Xaa-Pro aminopeptidase